MYNDDVSLKGGENMTERQNPAEQQKPFVGKSFTDVRKLSIQHAPRILNNLNVAHLGIAIHETDKNRQFVIEVFLKDELSPEQLEQMEKTIEAVPVLYEVGEELTLQKQQTIR